MTAQRVISADSHMTEPGDLWVERLDRKYRDNAPRVVKNDKPNGAAYLFVGPGIHPLTVAGVFAAGRSGNELREHMKHGYEAARPSGWDPVERLKDQDLDGVVAEVLYSSLGIVLLNMKDVELQKACLRVYNDWLAEFCAHDPKRLIGIGLYTLNALPDVSEIERCAKLGLKGVLVLASDTLDLPYSDERFDPLWKVCSEARLSDLSAQAVSIRHASHSSNADDGRFADLRDSHCRTMPHAYGVRWGLRALPEPYSGLSRERCRMDSQLGASSRPCPQQGRQCQAVTAQAK